MSKKKFLAIVISFAVVVICNILIILGLPAYSKEDVKIQISLNSNQKDLYEMLYDKKMEFSSAKSSKALVQTPFSDEIMEFSIPAGTRYVKFNFGSEGVEAQVKQIKIVYGANERKLDIGIFTKYIKKNNIKLINSDGKLNVSSNGTNPYIVYDCSGWDLIDFVEETNAVKGNLIKFITCFFLDIIYILAIRKMRQIVDIPIEIYQNRKLIFDLAKNDFKTQFAGSYLGIIWAFIQPIVTVLVYWFVFEKGLKSGGVNTSAGIMVPFVLWLIAGIVPWFFFQDALNGGTNALTQYSYLVKKVVFKISILPIVKVISALFVHLFFIAFTLALYSAYGYFPDLYTLQIFYYTFCMMVFVLGLVYATCAIVGFFRDLTQIINIILQVGIWMTPIMWNIDTMDLPSWLISIFKLNPMYYIVAGYRDSLINKVWFWDNPGLTVYFWIVTIMVFGTGNLIFRKLKVHFADVL